MYILALSFAFYLFAVWKRPLLYIGLVLQIAYIVSRGIELGRLPLVGPHDTLVFLTASIVAFSIPFAFILKNRAQFFSIVAIISSIFTAFAMTTKQHDSPLPPVLKTFWFECHVVLAFMSYALFGIAAVLGGLDLSRLKNVSMDMHEIDGLGYRAVLIGYCLFTLSMIFGGIWAYLAWGTYWIWTPKELWTSILWAYYSFYLHARLRQWWMGRPMAWLGIAGFVVVMFTYLGVSLLMKSSHSF
ncbi:MAG: cytochrome c biogenesis protein CcsA [Thermodesulfovibrionia bacterium]|nr:cytochrome c biogenesis protein CcsA [Thermodesulfovibrionia bacterium]